MNGWKVTAIIFMILFFLQIIFFGYIVKVGIDEIDKETECSINICANTEAYVYDSYNSICQCYTDNILVKEEYVR